MPTQKTEWVCVGLVGLFVGDIMAKYAPNRRQFTPRVYPGTAKFTLEFTLEPENHPLMAPLWLGEQL
jgi:hypothetical protein